MDGDDLAHLVGVLEEIRFPQTSRFMLPSKVGGKPAWLVPSSLPDVSCESCRNQMTFLIQLYAPDSEREHAFHRTIMVFVCLKCRCFLRCFRAQLPLHNSFYGTALISAKDVPLQDELLDKACCDSCGMAVHSATSCRPLPEYGLDIDEVDEIEIDAEEEEDVSEEMSEDCDLDIPGSADALMVSSDMNIDSSEMDLFNEFTETQIEKDRSFRLFKRFVQEAPSNHVIFYSCGGNPLWITDTNQMSGEPPSCEHCGSPRQFEFQIQPQLIYHLMKRLRGFPMGAAPFEWGVVAVYTCKNNCSDPSSSYTEEFVFNQLEPSEWLDFGARKKVDFTQDKTNNKAPVVEERASDDDEWI